MACYQIIDPEINAKCDIVEAADPDAAVDIHVRKAGWDDYADFLEGASRHNGVRWFYAIEILPQEVPTLKAA